MNRRKNSIERAQDRVERIIEDMTEKGLIERPQPALPPKPKRRTGRSLLLGLIVLGLLGVVLLNRPELRRDGSDLQTMLKTTWSGLVRAATNLKTILTEPAALPPPFRFTPRPPTATPALAPTAPPTVPSGLTPTQPSPLPGLPLAVSQSKFQILFTIEQIELEAESLTLFISLKRTGSDPLLWYGDQDNLANIFLQAEGQTYPALAVGEVVAAERTDLQPDQTYQGWLRFARPAAEQFTFNYPEMAATTINLAGEGR